MQYKYHISYGAFRKINLLCPICFCRTIAGKHPWKAPVKPANQHNKTRSEKTGSFLMSSEGDVRGERLIENNRLTTAPAIKKQAASTK